MRNPRWQLMYWGKDKRGARPRVLERTTSGVNVIIQCGCITCFYEQHVLDGMMVPAKKQPK